MTTLKKEEQKVYTGIAAMERATVHPIIRNKKDAVMFYTIEEDGTVMGTSLNGGKKAKRSRDMAFFMRNEFVDYIEPLKEGDYAKVLGNEHTRPAAGSHRFEEGTIVKLLNPTTGYEGFRAEFLDRHDWWNVHIKDLAPVTAEEVEAFKLAEKRKKLKVGDIVKVISSEASANADGCGRHGIEVGTIVKLAEKSRPKYDGYRTELLNGETPSAPYVHVNDVVPATKEEVLATQQALLKVGDFVRVLKGDNGFAKKDEIVKITEDDGIGVPFRLERLDGEYAGYQTKTCVVPATEKEIAAAKGEKKAEGRLKEGEFAKVLADGMWHPLNTGDIVEVIRDEHDHQPFYSKRLEDGKTAYFEVKQLRRATEEEITKVKEEIERKKKEAEAAALKAQQGALQVGDIVKVLENGSHGFTEGDVLRIYDIVNYGHNRIRKDYFYNRELALATGEEEAAAEKTAQKTELKEGGYARVIANTCNHGFPIGEIIKLTCTHAAGFKAHYLDGHDFWFMKLADLEPVTTEEAVQKPLTKGDYAKVTRRAFNTIVQVGDIVKIIKDDNSMIPFEIETLEGKDVGWIPAADVEPVAKEEVKKAKRKAEEEKARKVEREKYEEVGRKVGELKAGDIVRITSLYGATKVSVGDLVEVRSARGDGDFHDTKHGYILKGELVVPVEKRFDKKA
ncbi:hypothetical protein [Bacillus thuringiensis]|uniref:hypothetical protein n=1 Tax=Bacillus thuringiensis TaxID=1428 RepID=UPI000BA24D10|nr:hypothetical protein [Bacillus thuringiensis]